MAVPASVGQNTQIINLCDLTESDDEHMSAPASSSGGALVPALANAKKQRQPKRSDAELIEVYKQDKKAAQERKQTAINNNNKSGKKKAAEQVKDFALKLKKAQIRKKNATAKDKKKRARSKKSNAVKKPRAARKPKVLVVASVEINEADDVGAVDSTDHVMNDVGAAADVAQAGSPRPDMPESQPSAGFEWVWVTRPDDWWRQNDYMCWCGRRYDGAEPPHEDHNHGGVWVEKRIGWKEGDAEQDSEEDEQQQDDNDSDGDNYSDEAFRKWKAMCTCTGDVCMGICDCGAVPESTAAGAPSRKEYYSDSSDYDDEQVSKKQIPAQGNGGAAVSALGKEVVPAFSAGKWHHDVDVLFKQLEKDAKLNMATLDDKTLDVLKPLPFEVALLCLGKVRDEKPVIRDMNAFIVKNAAHLRNQWGLDDASSSSSSSGEDEDEDEDV